MAIIPCMQNQKMDKVVVLARGLGTRMRRSDAAAQVDGRQAAVAEAGIKALIPIDRPFLDYVLSAAADAGYRHVCLVIGPEQEAIREYYGGKVAAEKLDFTFACQPEPRGTADAVAAAEAFAGDDPFAVINSDNYYPVEALRALREQSGSAVALFERDAMLTGNVPESRIKSFAVGKIDESGHLSRILEKPDEATLASLPRPLLAEHELLAVWAVDFQGVPGDQAVGPRRVRDSRRGSTRHQRSRRAVCRREDSRAGARYDLPRRHRFGGGDSGGNQGRTMIELSFPGDLTDVDELATQLFTTGLSRGACESKARLFARAASALSITGEAGSGQPPLAFFVPGRIEVLGKHTDYAGGRTMVAAVERGFCIAALPRDDRQIVVIDAANGETIVFLADPDLQPQAGSWSNYPMTVARRVARNFPGAVRGADIALDQRFAARPQE